MRWQYRRIDMFGYVTINKNELKVRDYNRYRTFYCGLCYCLKKKYGIVGQSILSYDLTFLDILINALYEDPLIDIKKSCLVHPGRRHEMVFNEITDYVADISVILSYYKAVDDLEDNRSLRGKTVSKALSKAFNRAASAYPDKARTVRDCVGKLGFYEKSREYDVDKVAGVTGKMLAAIFPYRDDEWKDEMEKVGFYLGKFIYLMDAYEDLEDDLKHKRYNVWRPVMNRNDFEAYVENTLTLMMGDCAKAFEKLPIIQDVDILRNIIYSGVWTKYAAMQNKRQKEVTEDDN